jgi:hypothetical protein
MSDPKEEEKTNVVNLDTFRDRRTTKAPVSNFRSKTNQTPENKAKKKASSNDKLQAALDKYGSSSGNVMKQQFKKKVDLEEKQDGDI